MASNNPHDSFIIEGSAPLKGDVIAAGNKNEALPCLIACLITDETVRLENVPKIKDIDTLCAAMRELGAQIDWIGENTLEVNGKGVSRHDPSPAQCQKVRGSILFLGALLARLGKIILPLPGGDVIGARTLDPHFDAMITAGAAMEFGKEIKATLAQYRGGDILLDEPSVTGTENILILAAAFDAKTVIHNAACEPHVIGLCNMLVGMGARIEGIGSNRLTVNGTSNPKGCTHKIGPDFMEVASYMCLSAASRCPITVKNCNPADFFYINKKFERLGIHPVYKGDTVSLDMNKPHTLMKEKSGRIAKIYSGPWPSFPTDLMSVSITAATQASGNIIFFEKMFESRMFFTDHLIQMGANIVLCDPHRIVVNGPQQLYSAKLNSPDVRAGMSLIIAALIAKGTSTIDNIYQVERGYMNIFSKLESLGAKIKRVSN